MKISEKMIKDMIRESLNRIQEQELDYLAGLVERSLMAAQDGQSEFDLREEEALKNLVYVLKKWDINTADELDDVIGNYMSMT